MEKLGDTQRTDGDSRFQPRVILTKADKLIDYLDSEGEKPGAIIAQELDMSLDQVYRWAVPLEKKNMVSIRYSFLHGLILKSNKINKFREMLLKSDKKTKEEGSLRNWL